MTHNITQFQFLRGTEAQNDAYIGASGEITVDITNNQLRLHDGVTAGGHLISGSGGGSGSAGFPFVGNAVITGSLVVSGSGITGSLFGTASRAISSSYSVSSSYAISSSRATSAERVDVLPGGSTTGLGIYSGSFSGSSQGTFTGGFTGDGSGLTNLTLPASTGSVITITDNDVFIANSSRLNFRAFLDVSNSLGTASIDVTLPSGTVSSSAQINTGSFSGSFTGILIGTASRAISASRADSTEKVDVLTGGSTTGLGIYSGSFSGSFSGNSTTGVGFPFSGSAVITGSLYVSGSGGITSSNGFLGTASNAISSSYVSPSGLPSGVISSSTQLNSLTSPITGSYTGSLRGALIGTSSWAVSSSWSATASYAANADLLDGLNSTVFASTGSNQFNGNQTITGSVIISGSSARINVTGSLGVTGGITGSLLGTASNATSASYAVTSSYSVSSSYAISSSRTISASRSDSTEKVDVLTGGSTTGLGIYSGSFSGSFSGNSTTGVGFPFSGSAVITGSLVVSGSGITGSLFGTASRAVSSSFAVTSSYVIPSGLPVGIISSSVQLNSLSGPITGSLTGSLRGELIGTSSWSVSASQATTASYAITSSYSVSASFGTTSSYVLPAGLPAGTISASSQVDHNTTTNYVADQHVAHSGVTMTAGAGLTGGGDITTTRTLTIGAGTGITVNADDVALNTTFTDGRYAVGNKSNAYNVSGSGNWFAVASRTGVNGRGFAEVFVHGNGGDIAPNMVKLLWNMDWTGTAAVRVIGYSGNLPISNIRATYTGSTQTAYLEIQSNTAGDASLYSQVINYGSAGNTASANIAPSIGNPVMTTIPIAYHYDGGVFVSPTGLVGIGTTAPVNTLQIQGNVSASSYTSSIANGVGYFGTASRALSSSRADSTEKVDVLTGGSTTGLGIYSGSFSGSFSGGGSFGGQVLTLGNGLTGTSYNGSAAVTSTVDTGSSHFTSGVKAKLNTDGVVSSSVQVDHNNTTNYVADQHIAHSGVTITAGSGLSGGGTIAATRTLTLDTGSAHFTGGVIKGLPAGTVSSSTQQVVSTYTNGTDNRVMTSTGTSGINGEANLTFDGSLLTVTGQIKSTSGVVINDANPTVYFQDTDNRSAMVHVDGNYFYVLRGDGTNATGWTAYGGYWPMLLNLENNNATFGGILATSGSLEVGAGVGSGDLVLNGVTLASANASYHTLRRRDGQVGIYLGGADPANYHDNTSHFFRSRTGENMVSVYSAGSTKFEVGGRAKLRATGSTSAGIWYTNAAGTENVFAGMQGTVETDAWGVYSAAAWRLNVTNAGLVGIGITPAVKFHVNDGSARNFLVTTDASQMGTSGIAIGSFNDAASAYAPLSILSSVATFNSNVGIQTTASAYPLQIRRGGGAGSLGISIDSVGGIARVAQYYAIGDTTTATTGHAFYTRNATAVDNLAVVIGNTGNVGIGIAPALDKLDVRGNIRVGAGASGGSLVDGIYISNTTHANIRGIEFFASTTENPRAWIAHTSTVSSQLLTFNSTYSSGTGFANFAFLNGKVGIGTTAPAVTFQINAGHTDATARIYSTGDGAGNDSSLDMWASEPSLTYSGAGIGTNVAMSSFYGRRNTAYPQSYQRYYNGEILFYTTTTATTAPSVVIGNTGKVGIGTSSPSATLQIQGNVSASSYTSSVATGIGYFGTASRAVSSSRADSTEKVDVLTGGSTTGLGIYSGSFSGSFIGVPTAVVTTYTNGTDNRVMTSTGAAGINGESTLTYDGTTLYVNGALGVGTSTPTTVGLIRATNDVVAYYSSDIRLKANPVVITDALVKLNKLSGYEFDWIPATGIHENEGHDIGVIAQEVVEVLPEIVTTRENGYMAVKYEKIIPLLIQAIKEQQIQIDALKAQLQGE